MIAWVIYFLARWCSHPQRFRIGDASAEHCEACGKLRVKRPERFIATMESFPTAFVDKTTFNVPATWGPWR